MSLCPDCNGAKVVHVATLWSKPFTAPCKRCEGMGRVTEEMIMWIRHGEKLREAP